MFLRFLMFLIDFFLWMRHSSSGCSFEKALCAKVHRLSRGSSQRLHPAQETGRRTPEGSRTSARPSSAGARSCGNNAMRQVRRTRRLVHVDCDALASVHLRRLMRFSCLLKRRPGNFAHSLHSTYVVPSVFSIRSRGVI